MQTYGLIGHPLGHSFSARFFAEKFAMENISARYDNYDLTDISEVEQLRHLQGFNVTIPYKQAILPYLASISPEAQAIGAVNTVRVVDGQFHGHNTDVIGFRQSLCAWLAEQNIGPSSLRALVLGTGGASKAVCHALTQLDIHWQYVSRTPAKGHFCYADLHAEPSILREHRLIINCTPLGTYPKVDTCPDLPYSNLESSHLLYDLVYNPEETLYLHHGRLAGCATKNGLEMLHLQALAAWDIWQM